jgi:hypothetical protein
LQKQCVEANFPDRIQKQHHKSDSIWHVPWQNPKTQFLKPYIYETNLSGKATHANLLTFAQLDDNDFCVRSVGLVSSRLVLHEFATGRKNIGIVGSQIIGSHSSSRITVTFDI